MQYKLITMLYLQGHWTRWQGSPIAGTCFAVAHFNLPAVDPPFLCGIFVMFVVAATMVVPSTLSKRAKLSDLALKALGNRVHMV